MKANPNKIRSLIIVGDPCVQEDLLGMPASLIPELKVVGVALSGAEGHKKIISCQPDLIFLEIELPDMIGFEMLGMLNNIRFRIVFLSSTAQHAVRAIHFNALDYILKPVQPKALKRAVGRYISNNPPQKTNNPAKRASGFKGVNQFIDHQLYLHNHEGDEYLALSSIIRIEGQRNYSTLHLSGNITKLTTKTLGEFERLLEDKGFFRCHKSHIINVEHVQHYSGNLSVMLSDDIIIPVARRKKKAFRIWYESCIT